MAAINIINMIFPSTLAIINKSANSLAVVGGTKNASSGLNYIIGGLVIIVIILIGSTIFSKRKS